MAKERHWRRRCPSIEFRDPIGCLPRGMWMSPRCTIPDAIARIMSTGLAYRSSLPGPSGGTRLLNMSKSRQVDKMCLSSLTLVDLLC
jgi:hypothetical protein